MADKQDLLIFPYNGNGLEALACIGEQYRFIGFIDDTPEKIGISQYGFEVFDRKVLTKRPDALVLAVPGSPASYKSRRQVIASLELTQERFATVIHPKATISPFATIGSNVLIMAGVVITSNAVIGSHTCILPNTVIHHDVTIGDWSLVGSNVTIAGNTKVEKNCYIGSGTSLINNIVVGANTLIGLGSNVINSMPRDAKAVGNPARQLLECG
jgi:sugar O-acyltransferase (sialic acid O-acetyltransferase NeuD family)